MNIQRAIDLADAHKSKLTEEYISKLVGLSAPKVWHLLNNLCAQSDTYLEVGCFKGSTLLAALYENPVYAVALDNFSMAATREEFYNNTKDANFTFYEEDAFAFNVTKIEKPIKLYFYDGHHSGESHYSAISHFSQCLADEFVYVCDDWDLTRMKTVTFTVLRDLGYEILECYELAGKTNGTEEERKASWWGGIGIVKVRK